MLEDRPLALCDSRSVDPKDLMAADRVVPDKVGEVYYLTHNPKHRWYWLEKQTPLEPFAFVMYDTKAGNHARCKFNDFHLRFLGADECLKIVRMCLSSTRRPLKAPHHESPLKRAQLLSRRDRRVSVP
jgi:hypothetical protein